MSMRACVCMCECVTPPHVQPYLQLHGKLFDPKTERHQRQDIVVEGQVENGLSVTRAHTRPHVTLVDSGLTV